jgi:hypothetical protein
MVRYFLRAGLILAVVLTLTSGADVWARERPSLDQRAFEAIYKEGKDVFYKTLTKLTWDRPLSGHDRQLLARAEEKFPGLYEYLMHFYYFLQDLSEEKKSFRADFLRSAERLAQELIESIQDVPALDGRSVLSPLLMTAGYGMSEDIPSFRYILKAMENATKEQWAWQVLETRKVHRLANGEGITLAIIDSGIDPTIREIRGRISGTKNFLASSSPLAKKGRYPYDWTGHGTFVTCLAYQVAPKARLLIVKVASPPKKGSLSFSRWTAYRFAAGILWAAKNGADVINLSYASTWDIPAFQETCRYCWKRNIILVAAAGNTLNDHDQDLFYYPAAYPWTIAVGGVEKKGGLLEVWENSARGNYLDVLAPSTGFWVQFPSYLSMKIPPQLTLGNSLAAPIVSAAVALILSAMEQETLQRLKEEPGKLVETVRDFLHNTASNQKLGFEFPNAVSGYGLIDILKAVERAKTWARSSTQAKAILF